MLFEKSTANADGEPGITASSDLKIVVHGVEYESVDEMPTFARNLYEQALNAGRSEFAAEQRADRATGSRPTAPEPSFSAWSVLVAILIAGLVYAICMVFLKG